MYAEMVWTMSEILKRPSAIFKKLKMADWNDNKRQHTINHSKKH